MTEPSRSDYRTISPSEAEQLVAGDSVRLIDVRTPGEFRDLGHIPGALLLPVDLIAVAVATLERQGKPLLVYCEHGMRSAHAAGLLARAGFTGVLNMAGGMSCWRGPRDHSPGDPFGPAGPSSWLIDNADLLPRGGTVLDLACGRGRHALLMASAGYSVRAVDSDPERVEALRLDARRLELPLEAELMDLESGTPDLGDATHDVILVFHYLHRPLFPSITRALRPGGLLLYETFTVDQALRGHPKNPDFLLQHGELARLVEPLRVERQRDGEFEQRMVASVAARRIAG
ncbi:MAG TPA: rhodanese-like domain-containing protein [Patescibacteria group bacterium]|jgi:rhodanese-related sulfurtransferase|nr:rhodanese-like domain-containing protein [Patescibacteria group bacterium]